ncbi:MAG: hypothetical protein QOG38_3542 [Hyphomicrobiales bacterium]|jgi:hypothetical protein|nr:hypothetical protein [Hyphomicrobiales bacterium]
MQRHTSGRMSAQLCCGCEKPFSLRDGFLEVQLGQDGLLYCYKLTPTCSVLAVRTVELKRKRARRPADPGRSPEWPARVRAGTPHEMQPL